MTEIAPSLQSRRLKGLALVIAAGLVAAHPVSRAAAQEHIVAATDLDDRKAVFGTVESVRVTPARTRIEGTVEDLVIVEGDRVEAGQRLARIVDPKLALQIRALDAKIRALKAQLVLADTEFQRTRELRATGTVPQARLEQAQAAFDSVTASLAASTAERDVVVEQQAEGSVLAPAGGRVLRVRVVNGAVVQGGETVADIATERHILRIHLPERHARFIKAGDKVLIGERGLATGDAARREGRIRLVYPELRNGQVVADVEAEGLGDYFVGERVLVHVATGTRKAILVPAAFLAQRHGLVYAKLKDGTRIVVQPGIFAEDGKVEILSGLRAGDVLVTP